jgi:hypothetical protein
MAKIKQTTPKENRMKFTQYFLHMRQRPDRARVKMEWIEAENKFLRVILLPDGETVHNAFFDRRV